MNYSKKLKIIEWNFFIKSYKFSNHIKSFLLGNHFRTALPGYDNYIYQLHLSNEICLINSSSTIYRVYFLVFTKIKTFQFTKSYIFLSGMNKQNLSRILLTKLHKTNDKIGFSSIVFIIKSCVTIFKVMKLYAITSKLIHEILNINQVTHEL